MYEAYFGLRTRPFGPATDPAYHVDTSVHRLAMQELARFADEGDGMAALHGASGVGKTLLCHRLLDSLPPRPAALLVQTQLPSVAALLQALLFDLGQPHEPGGEQELRLRLSAEVIRRFKGGERLLVVVDEAQNLTAPQLEELRLLTNLESRRAKAAQVLLVGQPRLTEILASDWVRPVRERVEVEIELPALPFEDAVEYLRGRVEVAGANPDALFTASALADLADLSGGLPRRLNQLAHRSLLAAFANQSAAVDSAEVASAAAIVFRRPVLTLHHTEASVPPPPMVVEPAFDPPHIGDGREAAAFEVGAGLGRRGGHPEAVPEPVEALSRLRDLFLNS